MPDHDKPESTPDYASMFANFMPGQSQPPQVAQTPASNPASPQPPKNETETDDFLANIDKMTKEAQWEGAHAKQLKAAKMHLKVTGWTEGKTEAEIDAKAREVVIQKEQEIEAKKQELQQKIDAQIESTKLSFLLNTTSFGLAIWEIKWEVSHEKQLKIAQKILHIAGLDIDKTPEEIDAKAQELEQQIESLKQKRLEQLKKNKKKILVIFVSIVGAIILISILYHCFVAWAKAYDARILKQHAEQTQMKPEPQPKAHPMPAENLQNETQQAQPMLAEDKQPEDIQPEDIQPEDIQPEPQQDQQAAPQIPLEDPDKILARLSQKNRLNVPSSAMLWASVESGLALPILKTNKTNDIAQALSTHTKKRCQTIDSRKTSEGTDIKLLYCVNPNGLELDSDAEFNTVWHQTFHAQTQDNIEFIEMYLSFAPSSDKSARIYKINHDYATVSEFRDVYGGDGEEDRISFKIYDIAPISWLDTQAIHMRIISDVSNSNETTGCFYENEHKNLHSYIFAGTKFRPVADWLEISVSQNQADCEDGEPSKEEKIICQSAVLDGKDLNVSKDICQ